MQPASCQPYQVNSTHLIAFSFWTPPSRPAHLKHTELAGIESNLATISRNEFKLWTSHAALDTIHAQLNKVSYIFHPTSCARCSDQVSGPA